MSVAADRIRHARLDDLEALLDLHCRVFDERTHLAMLLGRRFLRSAYRWYIEAPDAFTLVAEASGTLGGSCTANRGSYYTVFSRNMLAVTTAILTRPRLLFSDAVWRRLVALRSMRVSRSSPSRDWMYLAYLAVDPEARGTGTGKRLIEAAIVESRARGFKDVVTAIHRNNLPARFMYKTLGFEESPELSHDELIGVRLRT